MACAQRLRTIPFACYCRPGCLRDPLRSLRFYNARKSSNLETGSRRSPNILRVVPAEGEEPGSRSTTLALLRAIMLELHADRDLPEDQNNAIDLMHVVLPGTRGDFVLSVESSKLVKRAVRLF